MPLPPEILDYEATAPRPVIWAESQPQAFNPGLYLQAASLAARRILASPLDENDPLDLYSGSPGVALFLAAHGRLTGDPASEERARALLAPLHDLTVSRQAGSSPGWQAGGLTGLGSLIHVLNLAARILDEPQWLEPAVDLAGRLDPVALAEDRRHDVTHGAAGTLLVTLSLRSHLAESHPARPALLALAEKCGEALLRSRSSFENLPRAWRSDSETPPRSGFAHGASGIALALGRLYAETGRRELLDAALEGLAFERRLLVPDAGNWTVSPADPHRPLGWCYGAAGIALARIALLRTLPAFAPSVDLLDPLREDLEQALRACWITPTTPLDHLCCGTLSRAEALLEAWKLSGDPEDRRAADTVATLVLRLARTRGRFTTGDDGGAHESSLFQGLAGIGYTFLRLAAPDRLPSVLLLE